MSKIVLARRRRIVDGGKFILDWFHRSKKGNKAALAHRLDHKPLAITVHDGLVARHFKVYRDANRLIASVPKKSDVPPFIHELASGLCF